MIISILTKDIMVFPSFSKSLNRENLFPNPYLWFPIFMNNLPLVGLEVLTTVIMKSSIFWEITLCSPLKDNVRFGGIYRLHLQGRITTIIQEPIYQISHLKTLRRMMSNFRIAGIMSEVQTGCFPNKILERYLYINLLR
jgi:hypothetical protein